MRTGAVKVAQLLNADLRPYRLPFLEGVAQLPELDLTLYVGAPVRGGGAPDAPPVSPVPVETVINRRWPGSSRIAFQQGALRMLRSEADVIVCAEAIHNISIWLIRLRHRRAGKKLVLIGFFWRPDGHGWSLKRSMLRFLRRSASSVIAYTDRGRQELLSQGVEPSRIFVSHNTLDTVRLRRLAEAVDDRRRLEIREAKGTLDGRPVLLFLGRLLAEKRPAVAVTTLRLLVDRGFDAALWVIGDGPERSHLERMAKGLPVTFLGPEYDEVTLAGYLASADLLVVPGRVGLSCVHGFASGLPCLTTDPAFVAQSPEVDYVVDGVNGYLIQGLAPVLYADRIQRLWIDGNYQLLRQGAIRTATDLSMDRMVAAFAAATTLADSESSSRA